MCAHLLYSLIGSIQSNNVQNDNKLQMNNVADVNFAYPAYVAEITATTLGKSRAQSEEK